LNTAPLDAKPELVQISTASKQQPEGEKAQQLRRNPGGEARLTAYPTDIYVRDNSIVYINHATNNMAVAVLYVIATCGSLFFLEGHGLHPMNLPGTAMCRRLN